MLYLSEINAEIESLKSNKKVIAKGIELIPFQIGEYSPKKMSVIQKDPNHGSTQTYTITMEQSGNNTEIYFTFESEPRLSGLLLKIAVKKPIELLKSLIKEVELNLSNTSSLDNEFDQLYSPKNSTPTFTPISSMSYSSPSPSSIQLAVNDLLEDLGNQVDPSDLNGMNTDQQYSYLLGLKKALKKSANSNFNSQQTFSNQNDDGWH